MGGVEVCCLVLLCGRCDGYFYPRSEVVAWRIGGTNLKVRREENSNVNVYLQILFLVPLHFPALPRYLACVSAPAPQPHNSHGPGPSCS